MLIQSEGNQVFLTAILSRMCPTSTQSNWSTTKHEWTKECQWGLAQFSAQFIPNYSEISTPLRKLTRKSVQWKWEQEEKAAFDQLKTSLSIRSALGYYETGQETKVIIDAGPHGLGLVLMQRKNHGWQPVFNASRSLTEVEQWYSQLQREALATRWGCERWYTFTSWEILLQ